MRPFAALPALLLLVLGSANAADTVLHCKVQVLGTGVPDNWQEVAEAKLRTVAGVIRLEFGGKHLKGVFHPVERAGSTVVNMSTGTLHAFIVQETLIPEGKFAQRSSLRLDRQTGAFLYTSTHLLGGKEVSNLLADGTCDVAKRKF